MKDLNTETFGKSGQYLAFIKGFLRDFFTYGYLLNRLKFKECYSFFYAKSFVPTGEGSRGWIFKFVIAPVVKRFPQIAPLPKYIEIETTTLCNKKCIMCELIFWKKGEQVRKHLSFDNFMFMVDQLPKIKWSNVTGEGSSFLNPDYPKMLEYLKGRGASVWLVDHLEDIDFKFLEKNVLPYVHGIYVSMDGATKETYEKIKVGCNFDKVVENLKKIVEYKKKNHTPFPHITFRYIVTTLNVEEMPQFLDLVNSIATTIQWGGSSTKVEFTGLLSFPEIKKYEVSTIPYHVISELKKRKKGIPFSFSHPEQKRNPPADTCTAWLEPYVMLPGYILPCCAVMMSNNRRWLRRCSFGNFFHDDFTDVWHSKKYSTFKKLLMMPDAPLPEICFGCRAFQTLDRVKDYGIWRMQEGDKDHHAVDSVKGNVPLFFPNAKDVPNSLDECNWVFTPFRQRFAENSLYLLEQLKRHPFCFIKKIKDVIER